VFSHTVLEHIFDLDVSFANLCNLSNDIVSIVVPFLQEQHGAYGDYWRFTPQAVEQLYKKNKMMPIYMNWNDSGNSSIYIFAVGSKKPDLWKDIIKMKDNKIDKLHDEAYYAGKKIIKSENIFTRIANKFLKLNKRKIKF
jgi:hypothetical protein